MVHYINRGAVITIADPLRPGEYKEIRNSDWDALPEIISFTEFLRWNYTWDYGRYIRQAHAYGRLPLPWGMPKTAEIANVRILDGKYDRKDQKSFWMHVICQVTFVSEDGEFNQQYLVHGMLWQNGISDFMLSADLYDEQYICCRHPLDEYLVPILQKREFDRIAQEIRDEFIPDAEGKIDGFILAQAMDYQVRYARLSKNRSVRSKLIPEKRTVTVYDKYYHKQLLEVEDRTILVDQELKEKDEKHAAIIHECVHAYLHNLFYTLQSYYRRIIGKEAPEFDDYFYSPEQRKCVHWMETQANAITRHIQMPQDETEEAILGCFDRIVGKPDWDDYRELIDCIKTKFGVSRYAAKKRILELGWSEVRGIYVYNVTGYVEDYDVAINFPEDSTYTLSLSDISDIHAECEEFAALVHSGRFIYVDGHVVLNQEKYIVRDPLYHIVIGLTEYARHHMAECCLDFKRVYGEFDYSYTFGELHKDELKPITPENRTLSEEQRKRLRSVMYELETECGRLECEPTVSPFGRAVIFHMERCGLTIDQVADRSGLGVNTISNMRSGKKVRLETVLAFCAALELEKIFRIDLMQKAHVQFDTGNPAHRLYMTIFELFPKPSVFLINECLIEEGFTPWTQERETTKRLAKKSAAG